MPGTPVSLVRSAATAMNYANPLVFAQSTMTQGCKQLTSGIKKANISASVKRDNGNCCVAWKVEICRNLEDRRWYAVIVKSSSNIKCHASLEWSQLKTVSEADHTLTWAQADMHTHTHTVKCLSSVVSWLALECFSLAGWALSFNLIVQHLLHGPVNYLQLYKATWNTNMLHIHIHTLILPENSTVSSESQL